MKNNIILSLIFLSISINTFCQEKPKEEEHEEIFMVVEKMPKFTGGEEAFYKFLAKNVTYPVKARQAGISGRVYVTFVIGKDGSVNDVRVLRGIGGGCDEEAIRVVKLTDGKWSPGIQKGKPVRVQYNLPLKFSFSGEENNVPTPSRPPVVSLNTKDPVKFYSSGVYWSREKDYAKAIEKFNEAIYLKPAYSHAYFERANCYYQLDSMHLAAKDWEKHIALINDTNPARLKLSSCYKQIGNKFYEQKKFPVALAIYSKAIAFTPKEVSVLNNRAATYLQLGMIDKACSDWKTMLDLGVKDVKQYYKEHCKKK